MSTVKSLFFIWFHQLQTSTSPCLDAVSWASVGKAGSTSAVLHELT